MIKRLKSTYEVVGNQLLRGPLRIVLLSILPLIIGMLLYGIILSHVLNKNLQKQKDSIRTNLEIAIAEELRGRIESAWSIVDYYYQNNLKKEDCLKALNNIRFGQTNYLWVHQLDSNRADSAFMLVHPEDKIRNKDLSGMIDLKRIESLYYNGEIYPHGSSQISHIKPVNIFLEFNDVCLKDGAGVVKYYWPKIFRGQSSNIGYLKMSYVKYFPQWKWVLGAGAYADHIDHLVAIETADIEQDMQDTWNVFFTSTFLIFVILIAVTYYISKKLAMRIINHGKELYETQQQLANEVAQLKKAKKEIAEMMIASDIARKKAEDAEYQSRQAKKELEISNMDLELAKQKALELATKAEQANIAKSQFLANMSHEIRTPMNSIIGFGRILKEEIIDEIHKEYTELVVDSAENLLCLINDILDFSKIEAGKLNCELIDVDILEIVNSIESMMSPEAIKRGVEFCKKIEGLSHIYINTDPTRLRQCLINVIGNAIKFSENGRVCLKVSSVQKESQDFIQFTIEDNGIGIPEDKIRSVFDAFTQADNSTTREFGGTGLGLTITKRIVKLLGGHIDVQSKVGEGTNFVIQIPVGNIEFCQADMSPHTNIKPKTPDNSIVFDGSVLVAEDIKTNQVLIRVLFERLGLNVVIVEDGQKAVNSALTETVDLIFMDMQMPVMNGYNATKTLREKGFVTPIIALTANAMKGDRQKCFEAGCDDYLPKPIDIRELIEILKKYLPYVYCEKSAIIMTGD